MDEETHRSTTPEHVFANVPISPLQATPSRPIISKSTPPSSARRQAHSDRFIPSRLTTNLDDAFDILENKMNYRENIQEQNVHESQLMMNKLLRSELLGQSAVLEHQSEGQSSSRSSEAHFQSPSRKESTSIGGSTNMFKYRPSSSNKTSLDSQLSSAGEFDSLSSSASPARRTLSLGGGAGVSGPKSLRKIPKAPHKVLDAPSLQDDYYLNLLDWSAFNVLAVALTNSVYLWSASTSKVVKMCEFDEDRETVTSISWSITNPHYLAVGTSLGRIQIWDSTVNTMVRELKKHDARVGALAWNSSLLASGSRDRSICVQDIRMFVHGSSGSSSGGNGGKRLSFGSPSPARRGATDGGVSAQDAALSTAYGEPPRLPAAALDALASPSSLPGAFPSVDLQSAAATAVGSTSTSASSALALAEDTQIQMSLFSSTSSRLQAMRSLFSPLPLTSFPTTSTSPSTSSSLLLSPVLPTSVRPVGVLSSSSRPAAAAAVAASGSIAVSSSSGRGSSGMVKELPGHRQEVCGLKWSFDEKMLASGGNDNKLYVWEPMQQSTDPIHRFEDHTAAVKAVAWSPHQAGLLASGGGTADRHIRFWNASTGVPLHKIDTGSQVCNLMWSRTVNEVVSTHGYSLNQIIVWKYPSMQKLATLSGHTMRVLYLAMSPDGQCIVTGAGDETLRFWNVFPLPRNRAGVTLGHSTLVPSAADVR